MMNRSASADTYFPPMASFSAAGMEATSSKHYLCDWETANAALPPVATAVTFPFDCLPALPLPMNNYHHLAFYPHPRPPLLPEYLVKREDGIGLNLGQRTYFSSGDAGFLEVDRLLGSARSRTAAAAAGAYSSHHYQPPRCQAEGCKADLSGAKHYHRRHKVCEFHSKATVVAAHGLQQRFCQQCSRFHVLAEFDEAKRSCRKRLADHNRRRRKPQLLMSSASTKSTDQSSSSINKHPEVQEQPTRDHQLTSSTPTMAAPVGLLTLGGAGRAEERGGGAYRSQVNFAGASVDDKAIAGASNISESSSGFMYHHCNTLSSDSNDRTPSGEGSHSHHLHLGQSMFELDFM